MTTIKIASLNCNGLRATVRNGFWDWFESCAPDLVCLQEVRMQQEQLDAKHRPPAGWSLVQADAVKKGYSGTAIWSKEAPQEVSTVLGLGWADDEGRAVRMSFDTFDIWSMYFPSGTSGEVRQGLKDQFLEALKPKMTEWLASGRPTLICGDYNIAHTELDLFHHKSNAKKSGFLPHERQWMSDILEQGWVDVYRHLHPGVEQYSWWSNRSKTAREKNVGWRIDYQLSTPDFAERATMARVDGPTPKISDHAPVVMDYEL